MADDKTFGATEETPEIELSDMDLLNDDKTPESKEKTEPKEKTDKQETAKTGDETPDESEEDEDLDEEPEEVEDIPNTRLRPSIKTMLEKVPEAAKVFKEFPQLRDAYFREAKFSALFPTIEDAEEASEKASALEGFTEAVVTGEVETLLDTIKKDFEPEVFKKFATNFLPALSKLDNNTFYEVSIPIVDRVVRNLFATGNKNKDQNQMAAAKILNHYLHDSYDIEAERKTSDPEIEKERKKLQDERLNDMRARYESFDNDVQSRTARILEKYISDGLDPENSLSDFVKNKIVEDTIAKVGKELELDRQHTASMLKLWKAAESGRFSREHADRIITAFLSRAKQLIPEIRTKVKKEALGVKSRSDNGRGKTTRRDTNTGTSGRTTSSSIKNPKDINWRKTSDMDILKD